MIKRPLSFTLLVFTFAVNAFAEPFSNLSFDIACKNAKQSGKIVFVDFYTTWCAPCRLLDKRTWPDAQVTALLEEKTVAIRIDAEKQTDLAKRYEIDAYPTMLLLKPDGTELTRLVGYREPKSFLTDFHAALAGQLPYIKPASTSAGTNDPTARMQRGLKLAGSGDDREALAEYLWCFDHGDEANPKFDATRLTILLANIKKLADRYPEARTALEARRDQRFASFPSAGTNQQIAVDCVYLNVVLDQRQKNLAVFDQIPAESPVREVVADLIVSQLLEAKRYSDVLAGRDAKSLFSKQVDMVNDMTDALDPRNPVYDSFKRGYRKSAIDRGVNLFEALAGLKRNAEALELAQQILKYDCSGPTRNALAEGATRAGNVQLAANVKR
jgi:thiol-disulfide isomerase/thioredoxin